MAVVTRASVFAAADALDAEGKAATLAAVRKVFGAGSFTSIQEPLSEWKARRQAKDAPLKEPAPDVLAEKFSDLAAEVWAIALELANRRLAADREALDAARKQLQAELQEAGSLVDQVSEELDALKAEHATLAQAHQEATANLATAASEARSAHERAIAAEARAGELDRRVDDLNAELERGAAMNKDLVKALAEASKTPSSTTDKAGKK